MTAPILDRSAEFRRRHIGPTADQQQAMLRALGFDDLDTFMDAVVPATIRDGAPPGVGPGVPEDAALAALGAHAGANQVVKSFIGLGYYGTITPPAIRRNVLENPGWYTAYTPYQPEISQGRLEVLLAFQTMVAEITGMDVANASLLDEATAAAEAVALAYRVDRAKRTRILIDRDCLPQTRAVVETRAQPLGLTVEAVDPADPGALDGALVLLVQYPGASGAVPDLAAIAARAKQAGLMLVVAADLLACQLLAAPGDLGADIVVGSAQRFGVPMGFGGPHAGYMAVRAAHQRQLPGRLVGVSVDAAGRPALRLALQTREQHIRREKATSNVCTAQVLLAVIAALYAQYHGPDGLARIAERVHHLTGRLAAALAATGLARSNDRFFDTLSVRVPGRADAVVAAALARGINLRRIDADRVGVALDETATLDDVAAVAESFGATLSEDAAVGLPEAVRRRVPALRNAVFRQLGSETDLMRHLRRLADKDIALDRAMIPLGSCTMKLNAAAEMEPISWPGFAAIHPFAPANQTRGYRAMIAELEDWLVRITGYDAVSMQPNAGSQGEYAGLLTIRAYHASRGEADRDVCLIPSSAHGTNPASASMAGLRVVVVDCDEDGNVDIPDLRAKAAAAGDRLAAAMVTYPSTHGVFEAAITEVCAIVHDHGGQVYLDGANLNALVGHARPGRFGADVSHLNLHKTFCIPHGGGGPGMGPIGVKAHLAPFLPRHPVVADQGPATGLGTIAAAPWGSAGILPISWAYIRMMGDEGLRAATSVAVLAANYVAHRLAPHYRILYTAENGLVAHECIVDLRGFKQSAGVAVEDVAKRLMDYGFHAPTMSWPVAGTLMVEPTESEPLAELDRFCDAMIAIRREIGQIADGAVPVEDSALRHAPHTAADLVRADWNRPYSRAEAVFPPGVDPAAKYWPPVGRIDQVHGDRHLVCSCPSLDAYREAAE